MGGGLVFGHSVWAGDDLLPGSRYNSARAAAMGQAYLPLGDDPASGLFYNPANLGKVHRPIIEFFNFSFNLTSAVPQTAGTAITGITSLPGYLPSLQRAPGQLQGAGYNLFSGFALPGFAFGLLWSNQFGATYNSAGDTVTNRSFYQLIPTFGTGFRLFKGILRGGYSMQWVNQASGGTTVASSSPSLAYNLGLAQGSTFSQNLGLAVTFPVMLLPSINIVARNLFGAPYSNFSLLSFATSPSGAPAAEPMTIDASFSIQPTLGGGAEMNLVIVDRDATNQSGVALMGHIAVGAEFIFRNKFFLRGGWGEGYLSGGLSFRRPGGEISLTYYNVEVGQAFQSTADTRFMLQYQLRNF